MAILQDIRNRAGVFIIIFVGVALFLFVVDPTTFSVLFDRVDMSIARINGNKVDYDEFLDNVHKHERFYRIAHRLRSIDAEMTEAIRIQAWNDLLRDYILKDYFDEVGISVSEVELEDLLYGANIHSVIHQNFTNQQTGILDTAGVRSFFARAEESYESYIIANYFKDIITTDRLLNKYNMMIAQGFFEPALFAKQDYLERNTRVDFDLIVRYYNDISDDHVQIEESDLKEYYDENLHKFYIEEDSRDIEYVVFEVMPSSEDSIQSLQTITSYYDEFASTDEPMFFVNRYSDFPDYEKFFKEDEMPRELGSDFFGKDIGTTSEILLSDSSYFVARIVDYLSRPDSVNASHILIQPNQMRSIVECRELADSLKAAIIEGANFEEMAMEFSDDPGSRQLGGELGWFKEGVMVPEFNDACFGNMTGDVVITETQFGVHVIRINDQGGFYRNIKLAILHKELIWSERTYNKIFGEASAFSAQSLTAEEFDENVMTHAYVKRVVNNIKEADKTITGLEQPRELIRWTYREDAAVGNVSDVFPVGDKFVVAKLTAVKNRGTAPFEDVIARIKPEVIKNKKAEILKQELESDVKAGLSIEEISMKYNAEIINANAVHFHSFSVPGIGVEPNIVAVATSIESNIVSKPIQGNNGVVVLKVTDKVKAPEKASYMEEQLNRMRGHAARVGTMTFQALQKKAEIEDNRSRWF